MPRAAARRLPGEPLFSGATSPSCLPWMAPQPEALLPPTLLGVSEPCLNRIDIPFTIGVFVLQTSVAFLYDVPLTTLLLHKRHAVPFLPLADHFSSLTRVPVNQSLANDPPPECYHVANSALMPRSSRWPAWDTILRLWLSGHLLLAPRVKATIATRIKRSAYRVLYVYLETNWMPQSIRQKIDVEAHDVIILDILGQHGLALQLLDRRHFWALHYGGERPSLEGGLYGDVIPCWCAALRSAFSAILSTAYQGPRTVFKDVQVALGWPALWPNLRE